MPYEDVDTWFEREMPNDATRPFFDRAAEAGTAISLWFAELTLEGRRFNTQIFTDSAGDIVGHYRKVHLPGHAEYDPDWSHQDLENAILNRAIWGFPSGATWTPGWECWSAMTAAGPKPIVRWG